MRTQRILVGGGVAVATMLVAGYGIASVVVYNRLTRIKSCPVAWASNDPTAFRVLSADGSPVAGHENFDTAPFRMPVPEDVTIPSRDPGIKLRGWFVPAAAADAPVVVIAHGLSACRRDHTVLLPAGMLHRNGFAVLLVDLREHGDSTIEDGHYAGGTEEYRDLLGVWDWLQTDRSVAPERIGLAGISLGAATVLIATGHEPRVAAVWADSSYADLPAYIRDQLARDGYPTFLDVGAVLAGRILHGDDLAADSPISNARRIGARPIFITHGELDRLIKVADGRDLVAAAEAGGGAPHVWFAPGSGHTQAMLDQPDEYERSLVAFFRASIAP